MVGMFDIYIILPKKFIKKGCVFLFLGYDPDKTPVDVEAAHKHAVIY